MWLAFSIAFGVAAAQLPEGLRVGVSPAIVTDAMIADAAFTSDGAHVVVLGNKTITEYYTTLMLFEASSGRLILNRSLDDLDHDHRQPAAAFHVDEARGLLRLPRTARAIDLRSGRIVDGGPTAAPAAPSGASSVGRLDPPGGYTIQSRSPLGPAIAVSTEDVSRVLLVEGELRAFPFCGGCAGFERRFAFSPRDPVVLYSPQPRTLVLWNWVTDAAVILSAEPDRQDLLAQRARTLPDFFGRDGVGVGAGRVVFDDVRSTVDADTGVAITARPESGVVAAFDLKAWRPLSVIQPQQLLPGLKRRRLPHHVWFVDVRVIDNDHAILAMLRARDFSTSDGGIKEGLELDMRRGVVTRRVTIPAPYEHHGLSIVRSGRALGVVVPDGVFVFDGVTLDRVHVASAGATIAQREREGLVVTSKKGVVFIPAEEPRRVTPLAPDDARRHAIEVMAPVPMDVAHRAQARHHGRFFEWQDRDGTHVVADRETTQTFRFIASSSGDAFVLARDDGVYAGSAELLRSVYIVDGARTAGVTAYDALLNRPDLVYRSLPFADPAQTRLFERLVTARSARPGTSVVDVNNAPRLRLIERRLVTSPSGDMLMLRVASSVTSSAPERLHVYADGVPVFGRQGLTFPGENDDVGVPLVQGPNVIELVAARAGVTSMPLELVVQSTVRAPVRATSLGIHIGVSRFVASGFDLAWAAKDATDIAAHIAAKDAVKETIVLTDAQVTREALDGLRQRLLATTVHDTVFISVATHGLLDGDLRYFLAGHDVDFEHPARRGIPYEALEALLDGIPARRRAMLIDACHSGDIDTADLSAGVALGSGVRARGFTRPRPATPASLPPAPAAEVRRLMTTLFPDVRRGVGAVVVSAAGASEFALESEAWSNGVFTWALISGTRTGRADANKDGDVTLRELRAFVYDEVPRLTQGRQNPVSRLDDARLEVVLGR